MADSDEPKRSNWLQRHRWAQALQLAKEARRGSTTLKPVVHRPILSNRSPQDANSD